MAAKRKASKRKSSSSRKSTSRKSTSSRKGSRQPSDALALLRADHQLVQGLFDQFEKTRSEDRKAAIAEQICEELTVHAQIEEEIFYPAAREALKDQDLLDEATVEHASAKDLIAQIEGGGPGSELFDAKVKVLGEYVKHHVKEEQNELFPQIRKAKVDLKELGQRLQERKMELMEGAMSDASRSGLSGSRRSAQAAKTASRRDSERDRSENGARHRARPRIADGAAQVLPCVTGSGAVGRQRAAAGRLAVTRHPSLRGRL